jgi:hypothetical protein
MDHAEYVELKATLSKGMTYRQHANIAECAFRRSCQKGLTEEQRRRDPDFQTGCAISHLGWLRSNRWLWSPDHRSVLR